jgi:predicted transcriptional regulator
VLSSEQLAAYVGYELGQVARALDRLLEIGLLRRMLNQGASGRMYVLEVGDAEAWLQPLQQMCATPDGRNALKGLLKQRQSENAVVMTSGRRR